MSGSVRSKPNSLDAKRDVEYEENAPERDEVLERYDLIKDMSPEDRAALEKKLVRKLDWKFLPMVTAMLLMNYLDRINVSNARLAGKLSLDSPIFGLGSTNIAFSRYARRSRHVGCYLVARYLHVLRRIHHLSNPRQRHYRQRKPSNPPPRLHDGLVLRHNLHACRYRRMGILSLPFHHWLRRRTLRPRCLPDD